MKHIFKKIEEYSGITKRIIERCVNCGAWREWYNPSSATESGRWVYSYPNHDSFSGATYVSSRPLCYGDE